MFDIYDLRSFGLAATSPSASAGFFVCCCMSEDSLGDGGPKFYIKVSRSTSLIALESSGLPSTRIKQSIWTYASYCTPIS